jgi:hypothetical protein
MLASIVSALARLTRLPGYFFFHCHQEVNEKLQDRRLAGEDNPGNNLYNSDHKSHGAGPTATISQTQFMTILGNTVKLVLLGYVSLAISEEPTVYLPDMQAKLELSAGWLSDYLWTNAANTVICLVVGGFQTQVAQIKKSPVITAIQALITRRMPHPLTALCLPCHWSRRRRRLCL